MFDIEDYELIRYYCWNTGNNRYLQARDGKNSTILMHRLIFFNKYPDGNFTVDHIGHNKLDNRKCKLRVSTQSNNCKNKTINSNNTSGITGVYWDSDRNKWHSQIGINNKIIYLGRYDNFDEAVKARKEAEEKYFGGWSYDNSMNLYKIDVSSKERNDNM